MQPLLLHLAIKCLMGKLYYLIETTTSTMVGGKREQGLEIGGYEAAFLSNLVAS